MVDDITVIRSMYTEAINHEPGITFIQTGQEQPGRPCIGSWIAYGLGSMNRDLPTFVVMNAKASHPKANTFEDTLVTWGASSAGRSTPRGSSPRPTTAATITLAASASGWRAAASRAAWCTAKPTSSPTNDRADWSWGLVEATTSG
jgi:hypothetical protein